MSKPMLSIADVAVSMLERELISLPGNVEFAIDEKTRARVKVVSQ
ncbi:MAG: hypothetical protein ABUS47_16515 [Steroidobacter sp.]